MYEWSTVGSLMFLGGITNIYKKKYVDMFTKYGQQLSQSECFRYCMHFHLLHHCPDCLLQVYLNIKIKDKHQQVNLNLLLAILLLA